MSTKNRGGSFHPSRISGHQKFLRSKKANEEIQNLEKSRKKMTPLNIKNPDWSIK